MKKLDDAERSLAEAAARLIAKAAEIGLPDAPDKLGISPHAMQLLARAHVELLGQVALLQRLVNPKTYRDPIGTALEAVGLIRELPMPDGSLHEKLWQRVESLMLSTRPANAIMNTGIYYVGELVQLNKSTLLRQKNFGKGALQEVEQKLGAHGLILGLDLEGWPGPRWACTNDRPFLKKIGPHLVPALPPVTVAMTVARDYPPIDHATPAPSTSSIDALIALYCRVMGNGTASFVKHATYIVRVWDGMDGCWTNCTGAVGPAEALQYWAEKTGDGTHHVAYSEIDYYRIFPSATHMLWDGTEGQELYR